jgi:hypothetical protein
LFTGLSIIVGTFPSVTLDPYSKILFIALSLLNNPSRLKSIYHNRIQVPSWKNLRKCCHGQAASPSYEVEFQGIPRMAQPFGRNDFEGGAPFTILVKGAGFRFGASMQRERESASNPLGGSQLLSWENGNLAVQGAEWLRAQCARRRGLFATRIKLGKAELTDCSSGKYGATSGERSTRFVPARKRATYFPRTPPFHLDRSYSRRSSPRRSCFSVLFFILFSLAPRCLTGE